MADLGPGDFFGEMAVLGDRRRTATVRTLSQARMLAIHESALTSLLSNFPPVAGHLLRVMAERRGIISATTATAPSPAAPAAPAFQPSGRRTHDPRTPLGQIVDDQLECWNCHRLNGLEDVFRVECGVRLMR